MRNKRYIFYFLFIISMIMLAVPLIPHHHHADGVICMKHDAAPEAQCPSHNHHHENDSCCSNECLTRFSTPAPDVQVDLGPQYVFIAILFTDFIIESLFRPQEKLLANRDAYRESLHDTDFTRAFALRGPPSHAFA